MFRDIKKSALNGFWAGMLVAPFAAEIYLHECLAHQTFQLSKRASSAGWLLIRLTGINPTTWSISHRVHHGPEQQEPLSSAKALLAAIKTGAVSLRQARSVTDDPGLQNILIFPGRPIEKDPVLKPTETGIEPRFQNPIDKWLSERRFVDRVAAPALLAIVLGVNKVRKGMPYSSAFASSAAAYAGYVIGVTGPGLLTSAYPERRDGFPSGLEAGTDHGPLIQAVFGRFAMHRAHHENPHLAVPPGMAVDTTFVYEWLLNATGHGQRFDGTVS